MGVVVGFVVAGKRRLQVARALGRHHHAREPRGEGRCLVVAPGGTVPVPNPPPVSLAANIGLDRTSGRHRCTRLRRRLGAQ